MSCRLISNLPVVEGCDDLIFLVEQDEVLYQITKEDLQTCLEITTGGSTFASITVTGNGTFGGNVSITGDLSVDDITANEGAFSGIFGVAGQATFSGGAQFTSGTVNLAGVNVVGIGSGGAEDAIFDDITADDVSVDTLSTTTTLNVGTNLIVAGDTDVVDLDVAGALDVTGTTNLEGATTVDDSLTVTGNTSLQDTEVCGTLSFCNPSTLDLANVTVTNLSALVTTNYFIDIQSVAVTAGTVTVTLTHSFGTLPKLVKLKMWGTQNNLAASQFTLASGTNIDGATTTAFVDTNWSVGYEVPGGTKECLWFRNDTGGGNPSIQPYLGYLRSLTNQTPTTDNRIASVSIQSYNTTQVVIVFDGSGGGTHNHLNSNVACLFEIYG